MTTAISANELLRRDIHPAEVLMPSGELIREARVFVTTERVLAWKMREGRVQQVLALELAGDPPPASRQSLNGGQLELQCAEGVLFVNQGAGCGCGSPLKALAPPLAWTTR